MNDSLQEGREIDVHLESGEVHWGKRGLYE